MLILPMNCLIKVNSKENRGIEDREPGYFGFPFYEF